MLLTFACGACAGHDARKQPSATPSRFVFAPAQTEDPMAARAFCHPYGDYAPGKGAWNYLIQEANKPGTPALTPQEVVQLRTVEKRHPSRYLRFAVLNTPQLGGVAREFVVFDATDGPCFDGAPGYEVLNDRPNSYYEPGENPYATHAGPGG